ncbi:MAG TPA: sialidase family protein [Xanthomonadales bacterium]|nr:sialidase family protein [Xanthomonadales bacterium]
MTNRYRSFFACAFTVVLACPVLAQHGPAPAGTAYFDVFADGRTLHLLVGERDADGAVALLYRASSDHGANWSAPVRVNANDEPVFAPHPGETPQIAARGERLLAIWTDARGEGGHGGPIASAVSSDGGRTWKPAPNPASDGSKAYHGLVELGAGAGGFHAVWLHATEGDGSALYYARSRDGQRWDAQQTVDATTCQCCWNRVVETRHGFGVLYRDGAPRDMRFATRTDDAWRSVAAGRFDWDFKGCPHVGGALAVGADDALHALVWTGVDEERAGLHHLASADGGATWSKPQRLPSRDASLSDLAISSDGTLVAVWAVPGDGASVLHRTESRDGGKTWSDPRPVSDAASIAFLPRIVASGSGLVTLWLERRRGTGASLLIDGRPLDPAGASAGAP